MIGWIDDQGVAQVSAHWLNCTRRGERSYDGIIADIQARSFPADPWLNPLLTDAVMRTARHQRPVLSARHFGRTERPVHLHPVRVLAISPCFVAAIPFELNCFRAGAASFARSTPA